MCVIRYTFEKGGWISKGKHIFNDTLICYLGSDKKVHSIEDNGVVIVKDGFFGQETLAKRDKLNAERKKKMKEAKRKMKAELEETKRKINDEFDAKIQKLKQDSKRGPSTTIRAPHTTAAPATLGATTAPPDEDQEVLVTQAGDITPAVWEVDFAPTLKSKNTLVYRSGSMVLDTDYSDGSSASHEVLERPVDVPNARRFDLQADSDRSEYITLSESGDVNYFSWEGTQFENASAIAISAEFMVVGANPVARDCVAKRLSEASKETIRLYEQLPSRTIPNSFVWALPAPACTTPGCKPPRAFMPSVA